MRGCQGSIRGSGVHQGPSGVHLRGQGSVSRVHQGPMSGVRGPPQGSVSDSISGVQTSTAPSLRPPCTGLSHRLGASLSPPPWEVSYVSICACDCVSARVGIRLLSVSVSVAMSVSMSAHEVMPPLKLTYVSTPPRTHLCPCGWVKPGASTPCPFGSVLDVLQALKRDTKRCISVVWGLFLDVRTPSQARVCLWSCQSKGRVCNCGGAAAPAPAVFHTAALSSSVPSCVVVKIRLHH
jgi:hypothetical protein